MVSRYVINGYTEAILYIWGLFLIFLLFNPRLIFSNKKSKRREVDHGSKKKQMAKIKEEKWKLKELVGCHILVTNNTYYNKIQPASL